MKKILCGILGLLVSSAVFAQSKDTVNGLIKVADKGKFPAGHFGQAAGYLPGDSIFVTNSVTGVTLQFLNLGTLDSAEGVAILLSAESAKTLGIDKKSTVNCKLNVRGGSFDESVVGQAVIDEGDAAALNEKNIAPETKSEPVVIEAPSVEIPAVASPAVALEPAAEAVEELAADVVEESVEAPVAGVPLFEKDEDAAEVEEPVEVVEIPAEKEPVIVELPEVAEKASETEEEIIEDFENEEADFMGTKKLVEQPSPAEITEKEEAVAEELFIAEEPAPIEDTPAAEEAVVVEEVAEEPVIVETVAEEVTEEPVVESVAEETVEDEYAPIVLVPTDKLAPEASAIEEVAVPAAVEPKVEPVAKVVTPVEEPVAARSTKSYEKYIVESESQLRKNCWYIQIASLSNEENLENIVKKYSKYPLNYVPNGRGGYRILIGSLSVDEYAAVLAKFKSYGFKDAFLKKR